MKSLLLVLAVAFVSSTSHARLVHYNCVSYQDKSEQVVLNLESKTLEVSGHYKGQNIQGVSTAKVTPNIHLPFISREGQELEMYLDVKGKVLSVQSAEGVVFQGYCF